MPFFFDPGPSLLWALHNQDGTIASCDARFVVIDTEVRVLGNGLPADVARLLIRRGGDGMGGRGAQGTFVGGDQKSGTDASRDTMTRAWSVLLLTAILAVLFPPTVRAAQQTTVVLDFYVTIENREAEFIEPEWEELKDSAADLRRAWSPNALLSLSRTATQTSH